METRARTVVKSLVWSAIGVAVMVTVGVLTTGSWSAGGAMALINAAIGLLLYGLYERIWAGIRWGLHV